MVISMESDATESSEELGLLLQAKTFSHGEIVNQGSKNIQFLAFKKILEDWTKLDSANLIEQLKTSSPAGKLYAAVLISEINCFRGQPADMKAGFELLKRDNTKVLYRSGCMLSEHKVSDIAKSFLATGQFQEFGLSKWCEKPVAEPGANMLGLWKSAEIEDFSINIEQVGSQIRFRYPEPKLKDADIPYPAPNAVGTISGDTVVVKFRDIQNEGRGKGTATLKLHDEHLEWKLTSLEKDSTTDWPKAAILRR